MANSQTERSALSRHLVQRSSAFFRSAMQSYSRASESWSHDDLDLFYLHAGTALELMCKASLASIHPALLADPKHSGSLFLLCETPLEELPPPSVKTITVTEALDRCKYIAPQLKGLIESLQPLIRYRNDVAHLGLADLSFLDKPGPMSADLLALVRTLKVLLDKLEEPPEDYYGPFAEAIATRLREAASEAEVRATTAIAAARIEFSRRYESGLPAYYSLKEALYDTFFEDDYELQWYDCPACENAAKVRGYVDPEWETEQDDTGTTKRSKLEVRFYPYEFYCSIVEHAVLSSGVSS
jgi:hypothetical protein